MTSNQIFPIRPGQNQPVNIELVDAPSLMRARIEQCLSPELAKSLGLVITSTPNYNAQTKYEALIFQRELNWPVFLNAETYQFYDNRNLYEARVPGKLDAFDALIPLFKDAQAQDLATHLSYTIIECRLPVEELPI
jgi:hypothetical protein